MAKKLIECAECGNAFTLHSTSKDSIGFCPFCGEILMVELEDLDDDTEEDADYDWPTGGC